MFFLLRKCKIKAKIFVFILIPLFFYSLIFPAYAAAPSAPTALYTDSTSAQSGSSNPSNITNLDPKFSSVFNDAGGGDTASKYQVEVKSDYLDNVAGLWHFNDDPLITSYTTTGTASETIDITTNTKIAQKFNSGTNTAISSVDLYMSTAGTLVGAVRIETDNAGNPSGTLVDAAKSYSASVTLTANAATHIPLAGITTLAASTNYWIVFTPTAGSGTFHGGTTGTADQAKYYVAAAWSLSATVENIYFKANAKTGDTTTNANDCKVIGATTATGKFGKGLSFDGTNDYADCGNGASLNITNEITLEAWVKRDVTSLIHSVVSKRNSSFTTSSWEMRLKDNGPLEFVLNNGTTFAVEDANTNILAGIWYHVAVTYDGAITRFYLNGAPDGTSTAITGNFKQINDNVGIGDRVTASPGLPFFGSIDEVRILNRALSADEVLQSYRANKEHYQTLYDSGSSGTSIASCANGARCADVTFAGTDPSLVGYWRMNEGTDDTVDGTKDVTDLSGNGNHGTAYGMVTGTATSGTGTTLTDTAKTWTVNQWQNQKLKITGGTGSGQEAFISSNTATVLTLSSTLSPPPDATSTYRIMLWSQDGKWGGSTKFDKGMGMKFDGTDDYVDAGNGASLNITNAITVEAWIYTTNLTGTHRIVTKARDATGGTAAYSLYTSGSSLVWGIKNSSDVGISTTITKTINLNTWYYVVATYDTSQLKLYVDAIAVSPVSKTGAMDTNGNWPTFIGQTYNIQFFSGLIDEVRIYNRALSSEEILHEYQRGQASMSPLYNLGGRYSWRMKYWDQASTEGSWSPTDSASGNYFVMSRNLNSPTWDSTTFAPTQITADNTTTYTITVAATDADGVDTAGVGIDKIETVLSQDNSLGNFTNARGHFDWDNDSYTYANDNIACTGGGYASKDTSYGGSYVTLTGCTTSTSSNQRIVNFTFKANNTWGDNQDYDIAGYVTDESGFFDLDGWTNSNLNFDVLPAAPSSLSGTTNSTSAITWNWTDNSGSMETGFKVEDSSNNNKSGNLAANTTSWQESSGLSPNTSYTRHVHAFNTGGDNASGNASATTLSTAPTTSNISADKSTSTWYNTSSFVFTNNISGGFGGGVQYFRYVWDTSSTHTWTGSETQWTTGTLTTTATSNSNSWYLHLKGYNSSDAENGTLDLGPFYFDATAPSVPGDPSTSSPTNSSSQTWSWSAATDALSGVVSYAWRVIDNLGNAITNGTTTATSVVTSLTQGIYTFFVKAIDNAGNSGAEVSGALTVNTNIPTGSISINSGDGYTNSTSVTLTLSAADDTDSSSSLQMQISNNSDFSGASYEGFMASKAWTLSSTDGTKTVYVRFKDTSGNVSSTYSDSIVFDATAPNSFELTSPGNNTYTNSERPTFKWKAASTPDATSGLAKYKLEIDNGDSGDFMVDSIPVSGTTDYETTKYIVHYDGFSDSDSSNNYISVYTKRSVDWNSSENDGKLKAGKRQWKVVAVDNAGNTRDASRALYADYTNPSLGSIAILESDILGEKDGFIILSGLKPIFTGNISDNYSPEKIAISFFKQNFFLGMETGRTLFLKETFDLKNTTDQTTLIFSLPPSLDIDYGKYRAEVTGTDKAGNNSTVSSLNLWILSDTQAKLILTEGKSEKEKKKITEELREKSQISLPELEKKVVLRREREAEEFSKLVGQFKDSTDQLARNFQFTILNFQSNLNDSILKIKNMAVNTMNVIASGSEAISQNINNNLIAIYNTSTNSYKRTAKAVPGIAGDALLAAGKGVYNFIAFNQRLGNEFSNQQENLKKQISQTQKETNDNLKTALQFGGQAVQNVNILSSKGIDGISKNFDRSQKSFKKEIAQTHKNTSDGLSRIGARAREGGSAAMRSILRPAEESKNFADRLIKSAVIAVATFESYMFDNKPTRIENVELAEIGRDYAIVTWKTNHYTRNNKVNYGESLTYDKSAWGKDGEKNHKVKITGLKKGKKYFFEVMSQNKNYAYDAYYSFETKK